MKVLIIDDEIDLCLLLKSYFQRVGHSVSISNSLEDGMRTIDEVQPDILFLDNNLSDGLGWKMAPAIILRHPDMEIYFISAYHPNVPAMPESARFHVIEKPISFADLDRHFVPQKEQQAETDEMISE